MSDKELISKAIANLRAKAAGMPLEIVTKYIEDCVDLFGANISTQRIDRALREVIGACILLQDELRLLESSNPYVDLSVIRHPDGEISVVKPNGEAVIRLPADKGI